MNYRVIVTARARQDLLRIRDELRSLTTLAFGTRFHLRLVREISDLSWWPFRFGYAREKNPPGLRQMIVGRKGCRHRVIYRVRDDSVWVLRVVHGARNTLTPDELGL